MTAGETIAAAILLGLVSAGASAEPVTDTKTYQPEMIEQMAVDPPVLKEAYATQSPHQIGELRVPAGKGPFPVAMVIHGGCWLSLGTEHGLAPLAAWLTRHGVATWNVDYRDLASGGGYPQTFADWAAALAHLRVLARRYPLDLTRVSLIGHSAGTTPVAWLPSGAVADGLALPPLPKVRAAVVLDGPVTLAPFVGVDADICGQPVIAPLMGGTPAQVPARYRMTDPLANAPAVKTLVVVVGALPPPPPDMLPALAKRGIRVTRIDLDHTSHFNLLVPGTADFARIAPALLAATGGR